MCSSDLAPSATTTHMLGATEDNPNDTHPVLLGEAAQPASWQEPGNIFGGEGYGGYTGHWGVGEQHGNVPPTLFAGGSWPASQSSTSYYYGDNYEGDWDSGTDSETESSNGDTQYDMTDIAHLADEEKEQELYWAQQVAKGKWRQYMRKPTRKVRRFFRRQLRVKGKGKGKRLSGKGVTSYTMSLTDDEYEDMYFGKGKSMGKGDRKSVV